MLQTQQEHNQCYLVVELNVDMMSEFLTNISVFVFQATPEEAKETWENQFTFSFKKCSHANW